MRAVRQVHPRLAAILLNFHFGLVLVVVFVVLVVLAHVIPAAGFCIVPAARAQETTFQIGNDLEADYDGELRESVIDNRFDLRVARDIYAVGATLLSHSPSDFGRLDPNAYGPQVQGIRKRWIEADAGDFFLRAGDSYATFGRGVVLNIFEDQTVDFDNVIDGVNARATWHGLESEILSGTNSLGAPELVLKAGRMAVALPHGWKTGVHGAWSDYLAGASGARTGGDRLYGGLLQGALGPRVDLYSEYAMRDQRDATGGPSRDGFGRRVPQGHAAYGSAGINLGPMQLLGEYKDLLRYDRLTVNGTASGRAWVNPPSVVPQHTTTLMNRGTHTPNINYADERAGLAEAYLDLPGRSRANAAYGRSRGRDSGQSAWEISGEAETWLSEHVELVLRGAETEETVREGTDLVFFERITWGGTLVAPVRGDWTLDLTAETQGAQESSAATRSYEFPGEYRDNVCILTLSNGTGMSWGITGEWTNDDRSDDSRWLWAEWNLRLGDRHQLSLGGGAVRGGQVCSGGVCRILDPFEGGRIELITTF
jgi:hypothetical protein